MYVSVGYIYTHRLVVLGSLAVYNYQGVALDTTMFLGSDLNGL